MEMSNQTLIYSKRKFKNVYFGCLRPRKPLQQLLAADVEMEKFKSVGDSGANSDESTPFIQLSFVLSVASVTSRDDGDLRMLDE